MESLYLKVFVAVAWLWRLARRILVQFAESFPEAVCVGGCILIQAHAD